MAPGLREPPQGGFPAPGSYTPGGKSGRERRGGLVGARGAGWWRLLGSRPLAPSAPKFSDAGGGIGPLSDVRAPSGGRRGSEQALPGRASDTRTNTGSSSAQRGRTARTAGPAPDTCWVQSERAVPPRPGAPPSPVAPDEAQPSQSPPGHQAWPVRQRITLFLDVRGQGMERT